MIYLYSFLICGVICAIAQIILDSTKLTPGHITALFVVIGVILDSFGIYDKIILYCGGGALVPITSFGHSLIHGALHSAETYGITGLLLGMFDLTASGIVCSIIIAFFLGLIFKAKD